MEPTRDTNVVTLAPPARTDDEFIVHTEGLTKRFGDRTVVDNVDLRVPRGSAFGYLGPNGAGKTTLIRMLLGLTSVSSGTVEILGHPMPRDADIALARVGAIVEEPRFHGYLTGRENLEVIAAVRGRGSKDRIAAGLERVGLTDRRNDKVSTYSLGMRQRLGVAVCLLGDPALLVLDEPMNGLDPGGILEFREMIRSFVDEGRTVVLSSHMLDEVEKTCDSIAIVDSGKVVAQGSIEQLTAGGQQLITIGVDRGVEAGHLLAHYSAIEELTDTADGLQIRSRPGLSAVKVAADLKRFLVECGFAVHRIDTDRASLETRFLEVTQRLGRAA
jgi:ABC-2 type transport system ATP-binding protein